MCYNFFCYLQDYSLTKADVLALIILQHYKAKSVRNLEAATLSNFIDNIILIWLSHLVTQIRTLLTVLYQIRRRKQIQLERYYS
jgi:hypothetical protein